MGTRGGVGASWLGRRRGIVAGAVGLAVVMAIVAVQLRGDGPAVIRLAAGGGGESLAVAEMDIAPARADLLLWHPVEYRFILDDGARIGGGEARAWTMQPPGDLEAAANALAEHFGLAPVAPSPFGDGFVAGDQERAGPTLWVGPDGDWSYHAPGDRPLWDCVEQSLPPAPPDDGAAESEEGARDVPASDDTGAEDGNAAQTPVEAKDDVAAADGGEPRILLAPDGACEPPAPPVGVPTEAEARALTEALFDDLDLPGDVVIQEVWADEWGAWVHGSSTLDGVVADLTISAGWGADAALASVSSTFAEPVDAGLYPTIDAEAAVRRLEDQGAGWGGLPVARPLPAVETLDAPARPDEASSAAEPTAADDGVSDAASTLDEPVTDAAPAPMPTEPVIDLPGPDPDAEPEQVTVTLVDVAPALLLHWDVDGTAWLLPGYRFTDADGGIWQVLAVSDEYLDVGEPDVPAPGGGDPGEPEPGVGPAEPDPGTVAPGESDDGVDPDDPGDGVSDPAEPDDGDAGGGAQPDPGTLPGADGSSPEARDLAHRTIGMAEEDAIEVAEVAGLAIRVVERDGEGLPHTDDHQPDRINLHVQDGIVVHATLG